MAFVGTQSAACELIGYTNGSTIWFFSLDNKASILNCTDGDQGKAKGTQGPNDSIMEVRSSWI
jgi:hypothetical protein